MNQCTRCGNTETLSFDAELFCSKCGLRNLLPNTETKMTDQEIAVMEKLADAWNAFIDLPMLHNEHLHDFRYSIHQAQRIVMCRLFIRAGSVNHPDHW